MILRGWTAAPFPSPDGLISTEHSAQTETIIRFHFGGLVSRTGYKIGPSC